MKHIHTEVAISSGQNVDVGVSQLGKLIIANKEVSSLTIPNHSIRKLDSDDDR